MSYMVNEMLLEALNGIGTLNISKRLIQKFQSLEKAAVLVNYIVKYQQFSKSPKFDGWFYFTHEKQMRDLCLTEQKIIKYKKDFIELGILSQKMKGLPAKQWFKINEEQLVEFLYGQVPQVSGGTIPISRRGNNKLNINKLNIKRITSNSLIKEKTKKINKKNKNEILPSEYFEFAFQLSNIITDRYDIRIPHSEIKEWERHFKLLIEKDGATSKAVSETLEFYSKKIGEDYIPVVNTGKDFRAKFIKLQDAMKRNTNARKRTIPSNMYQSTPETMKRIFDEINAKTTIR